MKRAKKKCGCSSCGCDDPTSQPKNRPLVPIDTKLRPIAPHQSSLADKTEFVSHNIKMTSDNDGVSKYYLDGKEIGEKEYLEWVERYNASLRTFRKMFDDCWESFNFHWTF